MIVIIPHYETVAAIVILEIAASIIIIIDLAIFMDLVFTDPGIIPKANHRVNKGQEYYVKLNDADEDANYDPNAKLKVCKTCKIVRPPRSFH